MNQNADLYKKYKMVSRLTAYKLRIYDIKNNGYVKDAGEWEPNYVLFNGNKVSRSNIIGSVVIKTESQDKNYVSVTFDDGTDTIRVKCWKDDVRLLENVNVGDFLMIIGKIREFNGEIYIGPEIVKHISADWAIVRRKELEKLYGGLKLKEHEIAVKEKHYDYFDYKNISEEKIEDVPVESKRQTILRLIEKHDYEYGADMTSIIELSKFEEEEANKIIQELLKEGEIFQVKAGKLKLIN